MPDKDKNKHAPKSQPPVAPPLPDGLHDFIRRVTPKKDAPLTELRERFAENLRHDPTVYTPQPIGAPPGSIEYMVEMRIRLWMHEKEMEAARNAARREALKKQDKPPRP
jgi:hypothetical protein